MNPIQLDIQQLRIKHILFKSKLRSVLYGGNYDEIFFSESGPVGQWFIQTGWPKYSSLSQLQELHTLNLDLNRQAKLLITLYNNSKIEEAHDGLRAIDLKSDRFLSLLSEIEQNPEARTLF
ncbi:histidine kinase [Pontibacter sp. H249]|uniref:histidine kinase n=1 Tax=Pontibacter sp. H249 TaxID=3133420 RepID=UPI0030C58115